MAAGYFKKRKYLLNYLEPNNRRLIIFIQQWFVYSVALIPQCSRSKYGRKTRL
jgi:hypothetical protein